MASSSSPASPPPKLSSCDTSSLLISLLLLCRQISYIKPPNSVFQKRIILSLRRDFQLLSVLFEEIIRGDAAAAAAVVHVSGSAILCLREILAVLRRFETLLHSCSTRMSHMRLVVQYDSLSDEFHHIRHDLSTLLDIFPIEEVSLSDDVKELVDLLRRQCRRSESLSELDAEQERLRDELIEMVDEIEREIVPRKSQMEKIFVQLGLKDSQSFKDEITKLEVEILERVAGNATESLISLLGLVRYAKCVLFGASTPRYYSTIAEDTEKVSRSFSFSSEAIMIPDDFRCPISLDLMRDPVVVSSGHTYDRESIDHWFQSGHKTCPKTGQPLSNLHLVSNNALKNLIAQWCSDHKFPFQIQETPSAAAHPNGCAISNKAASEAAKMTANFLVRKLSALTSTEASNRIVHELRQLSKIGQENRAFIAEAGGIPLLLPLMKSSDPSLQANAITSLLNLSILDGNKKRIMKTPGGLDSIIAVLCSGATWEARENAAATLLSISSFHSVYRKRIGGELSVAKGLEELLTAGPTSSKRDSLITILNLAGMRENIGILVEGGVIPAVLEATKTNGVAEMAVAVLAAIAKRGGAEAIGSTDGFVEQMVGIMRQGTDLAREGAASALVYVCRLGGDKPVAELSESRGIEWVIWGMMGSGSARARRKGAMLGRICRRWALSREMCQNIGLNSSVSVLTTAQS